ncbi:hypothetical protein [Rhizobium sp. RM]|uniref:hypothetical protein n=1 Tax=Rhizobium sp. RM TaxID=2748079 RepID=UPI00110F4784|nr:hypothetical protein [Rhizobium sp. RM]NWJ24733.1 hypothetical protein [Rhizobium sp. RM]TMV16534.1 hypothetical protein BJG94_19035 [Rhizobium sp. Td3]
MTKVDLQRLTKGEVAVLLGFEYGKRARGHFNLDALDDDVEPVELVLPEDLDTIAPSFVQGFFGKSALKFGNKERFYQHYLFRGWPEDMLLQIDTGLSRALMDRSSAVSH